MARSLVLLLALLTVSGASCSSVSPVTYTKDSESDPTVAQRDLLVGTWRGDAPVKGGGNVTWEMIRHADGTYRVNFMRTDVQGLVTAQSEVGIWGVSGGVYFSATRGFAEANGIEAAYTTDPALYDTYRIDLLTADMFEYESLSTGNRYIVRRVLSAPSVP